MNKKQRARKRAKELGISYQQAQTMYRPQKPPQTEEEVQWHQLHEYASDFDVDVEDHEESFFLLWKGRAVTFAHNVEGMSQAFDWIKNNVVPEYEEGDLDAESD